MKIIVTEKRCRKPDRYTVDGLGKKNRKTKLDKLLVATWNVRGLNNKETEVIEEMKRKKANILILTETKKKLRGTKEIDDHLLIYHGVEQQQRASAGVAVLIDKTWRKLIHSYIYILQSV